MDQIAPRDAASDRGARRIDRLRAAGRRYDALLCTDQANVRYATGVASHAETVYRDTPFWAVVSADGVVLVASVADVPATLSLAPPDAFVIGYGGMALAGDAGARRTAGHAPTAVEAASRGLAMLGIDRAGATVAVDGPLDARLLERLGRETAADLVLDDAPFDAARAVKDPDEILRLERVNRLVEEALAESLERVQTGTTEAQLGIWIRGGIVARGGWPTLSVVGFGERGALPEAWPSDRPIAAGEAIRLDVGATFEGYHADLARTAVLGAPDAWTRRTYDALLAGQEALIAAARPGVAAAEVFAAGVAATRAARLPGYDRHHCGHGIGLAVYETLLVGPDEATRLEEGMTLCLETPYYELGVGGLQVEDAVVIEAAGARRLGQLDRGLLVAGA